MKGIFLDTETSGLNPRRHAILEIALRILDMKEGKELDVYQSVVKQSKEVFINSDPASLEYNGFTLNRIEYGRSIEVITDDIFDIFEKHAIQRGEAIFICQNPSFDKAFFSQLIDIDIQEKLNWPYHWLDLASMFWAKTPSPWTQGLTKDEIATHYKLPKERKPHSALGGVDHLIACYKSVVGF